MKRRIREGFTLVELVAVIIIFAVLLELLSCWMACPREPGRRTVCMDNQHWIALAFLDFDARGQPLPGFRNKFHGSVTSWVPPLLPNLDRKDLAECWKQGPYPTLLKVMYCPSNPPDTTNVTDTPLAYVVNTGKFGNPKRACDGVFFDNTLANQPAVSFTNIKDGAAYTLLLAERIGAGPWHDADAKITEDTVGFYWLADGKSVKAHLSSKHGNGAMVSFCDGHQHFLRDDIDYVVYQHLMTPDSAEAGIPGKLLEGDY